MCKMVISLNDINNLTGKPFKEIHPFGNGSCNDNPNGLSGIGDIHTWPCMQDIEPNHNEPRFTERRAAIEIR